jgi:hypothetical protein
VTGRGERDDAERDARERKTGSFVRYVVAKMRGEVSSRYEFRERELRIAHLERGLAEPSVASAPTPPRPPLPNPSQLNSFTHATLQNASRASTVTKPMATSRLSRVGSCRRKTRAACG